MSGQMNYNVLTGFEKGSLKIIINSNGKMNNVNNSKISKNYSLKLKSQLFKLQKFNILAEVKKEYINDYKKKQHLKILLNKNINNMFMKIIYDIKDLKNNYEKKKMKLNLSKKYDNVSYYGHLNFINEDQAKRYNSGVKFIYSGDNHSLSEQISSSYSDEDLRLNSWQNETKYTYNFGKKNINAIFNIQEQIESGKYKNEYILNYNSEHRSFGLGYRKKSNNEKISRINFINYGYNWPKQAIDVSCKREIENKINYIFDLRYNYKFKRDIKYMSILTSESNNSESEYEWDNDIRFNYKKNISLGLGYKYWKYKNKNREKENFIAHIIKMNVGIGF
jgi:hypothetical protein